MQTWNRFEDIVAAAKEGNEEAWNTLSRSAGSNRKAKQAILELEQSGVVPRSEPLTPEYKGRIFAADLLAKLPIVRRIVLAIHDACDDAKV